MIGDVIGTTVRSGNVYLEGVKTMSGSRHPQLGRFMARWRQEAVADMAETARKRGANAVVAMRFDHREISTGWVEICAYGTAVVVVATGNGGAERYRPGYQEGSVTG